MSAQPLQPRALPVKPAGIARPAFGSQLSVKFRDDVRARSDNGSLISPIGANLAAVEAVRQQFNISFEPAINLPQASLDAMASQAAQLTGSAQPDFGGCMVVHGSQAVLEAAANALLLLEEVEWAEFAAVNVEPPQSCSDLSPATLDHFAVGLQSYHAQDPGLHMSCAWSFGVSTKRQGVIPHAA